MSYRNNTIVNTSFDVSHFAGLVIGPKGATIKALKSNHGLKKCFIKNGNLVLCGATASCASAKAEVLSLIDQRRHENRERMDRNAMVAETNLQRKRQLQAKKKREAEARLAAQVQAQLEPKEEPVYTYEGKFTAFDSEDEDEQIEAIPVETTSVEQPVSNNTWASIVQDGKKEESKEEPKIAISFKMVSPKKPKKELEKNKFGKVLWAEICDEEDSDEE
jgi:hypothetical protein